MKKIININNQENIIINADTHRVVHQLTPPVDASWKIGLNQVMISENDTHATSNVTIK
jgi:hypothetical protein